MSSFESADHIVDHGGRQYHIDLAKGEVAPWILLAGDPDRADRIKARFDQTTLTRGHREFRTHTGTWQGLEVTVMATGIGCDNTEIAVLELLQCCRSPTFLRVGTCGTLREDVALGDLVISTAAVRMESTSLAFVEPGFPAVAHYEVVRALIAAADARAAPYHVGLTATCAGFYGWQGRKGHAVDSRDPDLLDRLARQRVVNLEMEASTLFTLATLAGVRAGAVCAVFANRPRNQFIAEGARKEAEERAIDIALDALLELAQEGPAQK